MGFSMIFKSLGEGKCKLDSVENYNGGNTIEIPDYSEAGERVVAVDRCALNKCKFTTVVLPQYYYFSDIYDAFAFKDSTIDTILVSDNNSTLCSIEGILYNKNKSSLLFCPGKKKGIISVFDETKIVEQDAFEQCPFLTEIYLPASIESVQAYAFGNCDARVYFPSTIRYIDRGALESDPSMQYITICALPDSYAIHFARRHNYRYEIRDYHCTWKPQY